MTHRTGAILQRDGKTFAVVTRMPGGMVTPEALETIAAVARTYKVPMVKLTSGQRFMLIGIPEKTSISSMEISGLLPRERLLPVSDMFRLASVQRSASTGCRTPWNLHGNLKQDTVVSHSLQSSSSEFPGVSAAAGRATSGMSGLWEQGKGGR